MDTRHNRNFFVVDESIYTLHYVLSTILHKDTEVKAVEDAFDDLTTRKDIAILLINQHVANMIRERVNTYTAIMPALLEIPSKDHPYDPTKDAVLQRVNKLSAND